MSMAKNPRLGVGFAGVGAGLLAGIVFIVFDMVVTAALGMPFIMPLRMIGATALGKAALMPSFPAAAAVGAGLGVHFLNAAVYGVGFTAAVLSVPALRGHRAAIVVVGLLFGLALWLINFYVIAKILWPWFLMANPVVQFFAHTFFFGDPLGVLVAAWQPVPGPAPGGVPNPGLGRDVRKSV